MQVGNIKVHRPSHSSIILEGKHVVYIDPFHLKDTNLKADVILISHDHFDHYSPEDIKAVAKETTEVVCNEKVADKMKTGNMPFTPNIIAPEEGYINSALDFKAFAIPAYNIDKRNEEGELYHKKEDLGMGFAITFEGNRFFFAGDTDLTEEITNLDNLHIEIDFDVAFLPVSGVYVMTPEEAAEATMYIQPKVAVPIHWGEIVGTKADAEKFASLVDCKVEII